MFVYDFLYLVFHMKTKQKNTHRILVIIRNNNAYSTMKTLTIINTMVLANLK